MLMHAGSGQTGKSRGAAARSGVAAPGKAQQANSEDTVTISALETEEDTETDDESAPARQVPRHFMCPRMSTKQDILWSTEHNNALRDVCRYHDNAAHSK